MTKSKIFFYFCLLFVLGIFLSSFIVFPRLLTLGVFISGLILISVFWSRKKIVIIGFCLIFLILGVQRRRGAEIEIKNNELQRFNDLNQEIILTGIVVEEPDIRSESQKLSVKIEEIKIQDSYNLKYKNFKIKKGKILAVLRKRPEYKYGDKLKIKGKLKTPAVSIALKKASLASSGREDFNYKDYLAKRGIYSVIYWPEIKLLNRGEYKGLISLIYAKILDFKNKLRKSIYQNISPPQSSILGSMILGDKNRMSARLKEKLNIAGVRHIAAISGMHVLILSAVLMSLLIGLGLWRGQAFYFAIILIFLFIIMTGAQPSAIRAGIMGGLFLLAQKVGRESLSSRTIFIAAALMLFFNPLLLLGDVGFQLSFLAAMGIIYLGPILKNWLRFIPKEKFLNLKDVLTMTFSAYIFTLPIIIYNFGRVSLAAPLTNVLILPVVPLIMISGFISGLLGMFWGFLGFIFSFPVWFLLAYLLKAVDFFSQSWAAKTIENVPWFWLIISYSVLGFLVWRLDKKQKLKFLDY